MKRIFDFLSSLAGLIILSPVFLIVSLLIVMSMPGPVFFRQQRIGKNGKRFRFYKFRTMRMLNEAEKGSFHAGDNSRITPLGKILRKTKLDELPQLINVLKGEMSVIGPRPEVEQCTKVYPEKWEIVHRVKPGISDNASIVFRNEEELLAASENPQETYKNEILPQKLDLYMEYVNTHTFWGDLKIIFKTIKTVIFK
jgi:lipopolysaccharide/colanic/teichoic acid biosynthesis glycosyltransferase